MEEIIRFNTPLIRFKSKNPLKIIKIHQKFTFTVHFYQFTPLTKEISMKNDQNSAQNQENQSSSQENITISVPNPQIYLSKAQKRLKSIKFFQKTLKSQVIFVFLLVFFIINVVMAALNVKTKQDNKKLNEDNLAIYEMIEVNNITRAIQSNRINYLEGLIAYAGIDLDALYYIDFVDEAYEKYEETIKEFKQIDLNKIVDQYLNKDYSDMLTDKRITEDKLPN